MTNPPPESRGKEEFGHVVCPPAPPNEAVEARLLELLTPVTFANLKTAKREAGGLRDRVLTVSVMLAIVVSLVYRQVRYLSEILRVLEPEGYCGLKLDESRHKLYPNAWSNCLPRYFWVYLSKWRNGFERDRQRPM